MSDITERLRQGFFSPVATKVAEIAADEIDRIRAYLIAAKMGFENQVLHTSEIASENVRLRAALAEANTERNEQARLLGMSAETELKLRAALAERERDAEIARIVDAMESVAGPGAPYASASVPRYAVLGWAEQIRAILATKEGRSNG